MAVIGLMMCLWFTSGMLYPLESVPSILQTIFYFNPLALPSNSLRSIMLRGWGLANTNVQIGYIVSIIYTTVVLIINIIFTINFY